MARGMVVCYGGMVSKYEYYDRTSVSKKPLYLGLEFVHKDPIVNKYQN